MDSDCNGVCGASSDVPIGNLNFFFGEVSVHILHPFFNRVICFLVLRHMSSLYIVDVNPLSDMSLTNIFSHTVG